MLAGVVVEVLPGAPVVVVVRGGLVVVVLDGLVVVVVPDRPEPVGDVGCALPLGADGPKEVSLPSSVTTA